VNKRYTVYFSDNGWKHSGEPPWDDRPTAKNDWAAYAAANWATQQNLDWSERERVFAMLRKYDAEIG